MKERIYHLELDKGRAARYAILPGDPGRVERIAALLENPQEEARKSMQTALDQIKQERSPRITQGVTIRTNDSESGLSKITDVETPLEISMPVCGYWLTSGRSNVSQARICLNSSKPGSFSSQFCK